MDENVKSVTLEELLGGIFGGQQQVEPDEVHTAPTMTGAHGRAWQVDLSKLREAAMARNASMTEDHLVAVYIVEAPEYSPSYHSYILNLSSLEGDEEAEHHVEGATHELTIFPLSPQASRDDMLSGQVRFTMLSHDGGPSFAAQFTADTHLAAIQRVSETVQEMCDGKLEPEGEEGWIERYGDASLDQDYLAAERVEKAVARYGEAMKGLEVAAAYAAAREPRNVAPTHLRSGIDSVNISTSALAKLLISKGVITKADYFEAVADQAVEEYGAYAVRLGLPALPSQQD